MRPCGWCHVKVLCSQAVASPHLWGLSPLRPRRRRLPPRHHGVCLGSWLTWDNRRRWRGQKPLIFMRFHEVFHGSQHEIWPKQHNGKVSQVEHNLKAVSYTHLRAHETPEHLVCRLLLEKKNK